MNTKRKELTTSSNGTEKNIKAVKFAFESGTMQIPAENDQPEWLDSLHVTFGTTDQDVLDLFVNQILQIVCRDRKNLAKEINQVMPLVLAVKPENEVETMRWPLTYPHWASGSRPDSNTASIAADRSSFWIRRSSSLLMSVFMVLCVIR